MARRLLLPQLCSLCLLTMSTRLSRLIGSLTVGRKLALIYFLDLTTVIFISGILISEKYIAIDFAKKESVGNAFIATVRDVLLAVVEEDAQARFPQTGDTPPASPSPALAARITQAEARFGKDMGSASLTRDFVSVLSAVAPTAIGSARITEALERESARRLALGRELLTRVGNQSNLILDPDLDSYYTMSLIVLRFPELLDVIDSLHRLAWQMAATPVSARQMQQTKFLILEGRIDAILAGIASDYSEAFQASSPQLKAHLLPSQLALTAAVMRFRLDCQVLAGMSNDAPGTSGGAGSAGAGLQSYPIGNPAPAVIAALREAWSAAQIDMDRLLQVRNDEAFHRMWLHLGTALLLMALILTLVFLVARQIAIPIRQLASVAQRVRQSGDYALRADWVSSDEIGRLVAGFNSMLQQLDAQRQDQQDLVAQASAAQAQRAMIEAIPIPLMVTSIPDHRILHATKRPGPGSVAKTITRGSAEWIRPCAPTFSSHSATPAW